MTPYPSSSNNAFAGEYEVLDNNENVVGSIKPKRPKYTGAYWYMYSSLSGDENSNFASRDNISLLMTLSNAGQRLYFVILNILAKQSGWYSSEITLNLPLVNRLLSNHQDTEARSISKGTFYTAINDLINIDFIKRVKKDTYKVNSNYVFTRKDHDPERW